MQYAIINEARSQAFQGGKASCPTCGEDVIAKCGSRIVHHWAHKGRINCDAWSENETPWHRAWKSYYPEECCEVSHTALDGEIHRADIKTPSGIYIEVQHSPMSDEERISREEFYKNLVWVIDGSTFGKNFEIHHALPNPKSKIADDLTWYPAGKGLNGSNNGMFYRASENEEGATMVLIHPLSDIKNEVNAHYSGHHQYVWTRPRKTWLDAKCPVYIDFGDTYLARLESYDDRGLPCIKLIDKKLFIQESLVKDNVQDLVDY
tara:strand:- start:5954 stop:6742 length:789 start_codon:yes stop_codon:yes gene_type:complete